MSKFKYIKNSMDFDVLKENLDNDTLKIIDEDIKEHFNSTEIEDEFSLRKDSVNWWFGCITTEDLIDFYR